MGRPFELLTFVPAALVAFTMLLTAAFFAARRAAPLSRRRGGSGPEHREREGACLCLPDTDFDTLNDAFR